MKRDDDHRGADGVFGVFKEMVDDEDIVVGNEFGVKNGVSDVDTTLPTTTVRQKLTS